MSVECVKSVQATKSMSHESSGKINLGAETRASWLETEALREN